MKIENSMIKYGLSANNIANNVLELRFQGREIILVGKRLCLLFLQDQSVQSNRFEDISGHSKP